MNKQKKGYFLDLKNDCFFNFRLPKALLDKVEKFAEMLELPALNVKGGHKSLAIRLCIEDTLNRYMGPKNSKDELVSPYCDEMSEILPILKNIRLREKLENVTGDDQGEIDKIVKEFG